MWQAEGRKCVKLTDSCPLNTVLKLWCLPQSCEQLGTGQEVNLHFGFCQRNLWQKKRPTTILTVKFQTVSNNSLITSQLQTILKHPWISPLMFPKLGSPNPLSLTLVSANSRLQHTLPWAAFWAVLKLHFGQGAVGTEERSCKPVLEAAMLRLCWFSFPSPHLNNSYNQKWSHS